MKKLKDSIRRTRGAPRRRVFSRAEDEDRFTSMSEALAEAGRAFYARGWALGTSGNFSAVVSRDPLRLAITASSVAKGQLEPRDILVCDDRAAVVPPASSALRRGGSNGRAVPARRPSAETLLHVEIARRRGAGA